MADYLIRSGAPSDAPFIFSTWLRGYRRSSFARPIPSSVYFSIHHQVIERIFARPSVQVHVACDPTDSDQIFGYIVSEGTQVIHWVYTKMMYRGRGLARALLFEAGVDPAHCTFTHLSEMGPELQARYPHSVYNPYLL